MNTKRQPSSNIWLTLAKILLFVLALYLAFIILKPLLNFLLGISFWLIKVIVFITTAFLIIHLFLKLIFDIDLFQIIWGRSWRR